MTEGEATALHDILGKIPGTLHPQVNQLATDFRDLFVELQDDGNKFVTTTLASIKTAVDDLSGQLAKLAVTGRASFKQIATGFEESVMKAGIEKVIGGAAGKLGTALFGKGAMSKTLGDSPGNPIYTYDVTGSQGAGPGTASPVGGLLGKLFHTSSGGGGEEGDGGDGGSSGGGFGGFMDTISGAFKGLQHGGPVTPGRAYIVGERHPEFFIPKQAGEVRPELGLGTTHQTVLNFHVNGVSDFDSFKRSQSQIMSGLQNQLATAYARQR
jgi:hypothetical protein